MSRVRPTTTPKPAHPHEPEHQAHEERPTEPRQAGSFPIVGIGASAGGLEAYIQLLKALPADTGMAFVLVQHLAPTHESALVEILSRTTRMPVTEVRDEATVEPNHVYVIPPNRCMGISGGKLELAPREKAGNVRVIDHFLRALAEDSRHLAIGVILSGTASDGTLGLEAIKAEGGITFAQDDTATSSAKTSRRPSLRRRTPPAAWPNTSLTPPRQKAAPATTAGCGARTASASTPTA